MKLIKKFEEFVYGGSAEPSTSPSESPTIAPPKTAPDKKPGKVSPIRRDKPAVQPDPKAEKKLKTSKVEEVIEKFAKLTNQNY